MKKIVARYMNFSNESGASFELEARADQSEFAELKKQCEELDHMCRQMGGSDLEDITLENLQTLQEKLEMGLRSARVRECELLQKQMDGAQRMLNTIFGQEGVSSSRDASLLMESMPQRNCEVQSLESSSIHANLQLNNNEENNEENQYFGDYDTSLHLGLISPTYP
uniref:MADS-domain protein n=1 Tax=Picea glauca TaxID=3330 RepID=A0A291LTP8_PICGL|nr:MADS-domain protein [Picea glauca]